MAKGYRALVQGACKPKNAPSKSKYLDPIMDACEDKQALMDIAMELRHKFSSSEWTVVFKAIIVTHMMIRRSDHVMRFYSNNPSFFSAKQVSSDLGVETSGEAAHYLKYLNERCVAFKEVRYDIVREKTERGKFEKRLRGLSVNKGLLRETGIVQRTIGACLGCKFYADELNNDVNICAFRLLVKDLLVLFQAVNEGVINVLESYFEMSKYDAQDALEIYKTFAKQTEKVVEFLSVAKRMQSVVGVSVPNLRHAPVSLVSKLEEYLNDPNFETNRAEYKANKRVADDAPSHRPIASKTETKPAASNPASAPVPDEIKQPKAEAPQSSASGLSKQNKDLVDFFASIEAEQAPMFANEPSSNRQSYYGGFQNPQAMFLGAQHDQQTSFLDGRPAYQASSLGPQTQPAPNFAFTAPAMTHNVQIDPPLAFNGSQQQDQPAQSWPSTLQNPYSAPPERLNPFPVTSQYSQTFAEEPAQMSTISPFNPGNTNASRNPFASATSSAAGLPASSSGNSLSDPFAFLSFGQIASDGPSQLHPASGIDSAPRDAVGHSSSNYDAASASPFPAFDQAQINMVGSGTSQMGGIASSFVGNQTSNPFTMTHDRTMSTTTPAPGATILPTTGAPAGAFRPTSAFGLQLDSQLRSPGSSMPAVPSSRYGALGFQNGIAGNDHFAPVRSSTLPPMSDASAYSAFAQSPSTPFPQDPASNGPVMNGGTNPFLTQAGHSNPFGMPTSAEGAGHYRQQSLF